MNKNTKQFIGITIFLMILIVIMGIGIWGAQERIDNLEKVLDGHEHGKRIEEITSLENEVWLQNEFGDPVISRAELNKTGLEVLEDSFQSQNMFYSSRLWEIHDRVTALEALMEFPYVDQVGEDAPMDNDCGSAAILMLAKYYGVAGDETVKEVHQDMMGGDFPSGWTSISGYLESEYGLETRVITNYDWVLIALENNGYDISEIELVEEIPDDRPVIWAYATEEHWVVRYQGWAFDPLHGIWPFKATAAYRRIAEPQWGLGIIVLDQ